MDFAARVGQLSMGVPSIIINVWGSSDMRNTEKKREISVSCFFDAISRLTRNAELSG